MPAFEPLYYLAYGSNLHPLRLKLRLEESRLLARVELPDCRLCFHISTACTASADIPTPTGGEMPFTSVCCSSYGRSTGFILNRH